MRNNKNYDKIILNNWEFWACHGVYEEEKKNKQKFKIDITLYLDLAPAAKSDDIKDTVDYALLYGEVKELVEGNSYNLLECLAAAVAGLALKRPLVKMVKVGLEKPCARRGGDIFSSKVEIKRGRIN